MYHGVEQVGTGLVGGVSKLGGCILDSATQIGGGFATGVHSAGSGLVGGARHIGAGVVNGTQELATGIVDGTSQVGSGVWQGVRSLGKPVGLSEHFYDHTTPEGTNVHDQARFAPFNDAASNLVPGANQESCVQAFGDQYCAQGLQNGGVQGNSNDDY